MGDFADPLFGPFVYDASGSWILHTLLLLCGLVHRPFRGVGGGFFGFTCRIAILFFFSSLGVCYIILDTAAMFRAHLARFQRQHWRQVNRGDSFCSG